MEVYLDNAATTRVCPEAADIAYKTMLETYGNPSSTHTKGREAKAVLDNARKQLAAALDCAPGEVYFTSCGSEGDNWAIINGAESMRRKGLHIISSEVEHDAVRKSMDELKRRGFEVTMLKPESDGSISPEAVIAALRPDTVLVSLMMVNNETGAVTDIAAVAKVRKKAKSIALLHTDAVQGFMKVPCDPKTLGVDMMSLSAHKIGGPKGIGALYVGPNVRNIRPLLHGGGQEEGTRSGTEATAQIAGFAKAAELRAQGLADKLAHMAEVKAYCREKLLSIDGVVAVGQGEAPHILMVSLVVYPSANVVTDLGSQDICLSAGSACHRGKLSHVVTALGLDKRTANGVLRVSFGPETTLDDIDALYAALLQHKNTRFPML